MKHIMRFLFCFGGIYFVAAVPAVRGQKGDTLYVKPSDLDLGHLQTGSYAYLIVYEKAKDSPASGMILARMSVMRERYKGKSAIVVRQQWDRDSVVHQAYTVFDDRDFSTLLHDTYWRRLGYAMVFDFEGRRFDSRAVQRPIPDSMRERCEKELAESFGAYNLNWHDDLVIYSMLPYKANRTFMIHYYDPGFGKPEDVPYTVTGSAVLSDRGGARIDTWVLEHTDENGTEKYWISKATHEVLQEEDHGPRGGFRFKYKIGVGGLTTGR